MKEESSLHQQTAEQGEKKKGKRGEVARKEKPDNMCLKRREMEVSWVEGVVEPLRLWSQFEDLVMQNQSSATDSSHGNCELPKFLVDK